MIDIIRYLEDKNIPYYTSGKNVTRNWVNIGCIFCGDPSNHLGISLESGGWNCWSCSSKGYLPKLIMEIEPCNYYQAKQVISQYETFDLEEKEEKRTKPVNSNLLKPYDVNLPGIHRNYLLERNFDPDYIQRKYLIRYQWQIGYFAYRIIIPIIEEGQVINLTGRDVTNRQEERYKHLPNEKAMFPIKDCIYNIDKIKNKIIICEGVFDVWRMGDGTVATFGTEFTQSQISLLSRKNIKEAFILFDHGAENNAEKLANTLSTFINKVEILYLEKGDPAELTEEEVNGLRREINI